MYFLCLVHYAFQYICEKENQLDAKFIVSIFHETPLHVSDVSTVHHQVVHRMFTTTGTYSSF